MGVALVQVGTGVPHWPRYSSLRYVLNSVVLVVYAMSSEDQNWLFTCRATSVYAAAASLQPAAGSASRVTRRKGVVTMVPEYCCTQSATTPFYEYVTEHVLYGECDRL